MKLNLTTFLTVLAISFTLILTGCGDDNPVQPKEETIPQVYTDLPGTLITSDTTWSGTLTLKGQYYVLPGVTLTIEPGTTVNWEYHNNNVQDVGALITLPANPNDFQDGPRSSGKLNAVGTADQPIVFTSNRSPKQPGDWGGIVLIGDAPTNVNGPGEVEGLPQEEALQYGGDNAADNSGTLQYVRIEYVGYSFATDSELNGLSLYGVGNGTTLDHIQVYKCTDDGFEFFGGTVNASYLVSLFNDDDSFDADQGWNGKAQFWLAVQIGGADNGFEFDGRDELGFGDPSNPNIYNVTLVGLKQSGDIKDSGDKNYGMRLREDFTGALSNFIITDFDGLNFKLEGESDGTGTNEDKTYENYNPDSPGTGKLALTNFMVNNNGGWATGDDVRYQNSYVMQDPVYQDAASYDYRPTNPAAANGSTPPSGGFFDTNATYYGAFDPQATSPWIKQGTWVRTSDN